MLKNNRGFTILEIIITLAIGVIVITMVGRFLLTNIYHYNRINDSTEIMDQAQFITSFLDLELTECAGIRSITSVEGLNLIDSNSGDYIKHIELYTRDTSHLVNPSFQLKNGNDIFYKSHSELGTYIDKIYVAPIPENQSFRNSNGIAYKIYFLKDKSSYSIEKSIHFRNK
ncbi:MAG: prepilin-type N-terminal cleavage/methylation domain-containing protein [Bacillota bacterium]|nr:prepilin-type N-terminal cleavage/methylation domain-containing protein [Bacillota bacterium]